MSQSRVPSVDALRGLIMIIMALDHVRDFFHSQAQLFQPEDLARTTVALFFTRWVTHICAPVFMFTAGVGAFLWLRGERTTGDLSRFLWTRGLWLVVLELTAFRFAVFFSLTQGAVVLTVLWALGWSMVALGFLVRVPIRPLAVFSLAVIALHNLADPIAASRFGAAAGVWNILHQQGMFRVGGVPVIAGYPLVPWIFVMAAGYCFGPIVALEPARRRWWMVRIGGGMTLAFLLIRALNVYGDPSPWTSKFRGMTVLSFLRCTKYPPSLDFLLMTLGPALLILAWFEGFNFSRTNPLIVFGRVPLFYFLVHFYLAHALTIPLGSGYPLWGVYLVWIGVVVALYPMCLWFGRLKQRRKDWWLGYL